MHEIHDTMKTWADPGTDLGGGEELKNKVILEPVCRVIRETPLHNCFGGKHIMTGTLKVTQEFSL